MKSYILVVRHAARSQIVFPNVIRLRLTHILRPANLIFMIYFVQGIQSKLIKIGYTDTSLESRLKTLQSGSPDILRVIGTAHGSRREEQFLHRLFARYNVYGEWFNPSPELLDYIRLQPVNAGLCTCGKPLKERQEKYCGRPCAIRANMSTHAQRQSISLAR